MRHVWLCYIAADKMFECSWYQNVVELRRRTFTTYREAFYFAARKASKRGCVIEEVPEELRCR